MSNWEVRHGDCRDVMRSLPPESVDAIVSDPPYGLSFMGKEWDHGVPGVEFWTEALRVAKPGAHLVAFGGTRTYHRLAVAIEDAGWEVRDCLSWMYGSGFPKSLDVSKAMDKGEGHWRGRASGVVSDNGAMAGPNYGRTDKGEPITDLARQWHGWGTALKPGWESIILARKPLTGTVAANVTQYGTGAINVDGCRIGTTVETWPKTRARPIDPRDLHHDYTGSETRTVDTGNAPAGRWPANVLLDEDAAGMLGEPSRFFYTAKVSRKEREAGLEDCDKVVKHFWQTANGASGEPSSLAIASNPNKVARTNNHPTVKPIALMRWLCRLVTPPDGLILDPFNGSGSTGCAAVLEGFRYLGAELEPEYVEIARRRIAYWESQRSEPDLFG